MASVLLGVIYTHNTALEINFILEINFMVKFTLSKLKHLPFRIKYVLDHEQVRDLF